MSNTLFRFCLQTQQRRFSEIWSFFYNNKGDLYALRTSMKGWQKISFHESGNGHLKTYSGDKKKETKDFYWNTPLKKDIPTHILKIIYPLDKQHGDFPPNIKKCPIVFEEINFSGCLNLNAFFHRKNSIENKFGDIIFSYKINENKYVFFTISHSGPQAELPPNTEHMTFHLGGKVNAKSGNSVYLKNSTAVFYTVPTNSSFLIISEISYQPLPINLS